MQTGEKNSIFGSVKPSEIVAYVEKQTGRQLDVTAIELPDIKSLGTYEGTLKLHPEVIGMFKVQVVKQPK
jgi:large subunit ribosomal protein L9